MKSNKQVNGLFENHINPTGKTRVEGGSSTKSVAVYRPYYGVISLDGNGDLIAVAKG